MTCFPEGARSGSTTVGTYTSRNGSPETLPYFASSYARSMYSIEGQTRKWAGSPSGDAARVGAPSRAKITVARTPFISKFRTRMRNSGLNSSDSTSRRNVRFGSALEATTFASITSPDVSSTPFTRPPAQRIRRTSESVRIVAPESRAAPPRAAARFPMPPRTNAPAPPPSGRKWWMSPNAVPRVPERHGRQPQHLLQGVLAEPSQPERSTDEVRLLGEGRSGEVRRCHREDRIEGGRELAQEPDEPRIRLRVLRRDGREFGLRLPHVPPDSQRGAVPEGDDLRIGGEESDAAAREIEILDDLGPEPTAHRGTGRAAKSRSDFLRGERASDDPATFEHEDAESAASQVRRGDEAVVPSAHDDDIERGDHPHTLRNIQSRRISRAAL